MATVYTSLQAIKDANRARALRERRALWFDPEVMSFFSTTFPFGEQVYQGCLFITGETYRADDPRFPVRYSVRRALPSGRIDTVGTFQGYDTAAQARAAALALDLSTLDVGEV